VLLLAFWLRIELVPMCFIILAIITVWMAEAFNTVFEIVVDIASPKYTPTARRAKDIAAAAVLFAAIGACALGTLILAPPLMKKFAPAERAQGGNIMALTLTSPAFQNGGMIPRKYTCDGQDLSPPLEWAGAPEGTKSIALISDDPDAPMGTWVHWVIYNLPPGASSLPEGLAREPELEKGARQGMTDFRRVGYGGPCPPRGVHRYFFRLYALDAELPLKPGATKKELLKAMQGRILAEGELMGKYGRN
jgi:Raf kinase inhibitor-like YbhB/YbcL family protein